MKNTKELMHCHCGNNNRAPRWTFTDPCKPEGRPGSREEFAKKFIKSTVISVHPNWLRSIDKGGNTIQSLSASNRDWIFQSTLHWYRITDSIVWIIQSKCSVTVSDCSTTCYGRVMGQVHVNLTEMFVEYLCVHIINLVLFNGPLPFCKMCWCQ